MATTPTNLPIPSEDPRDLKFNAGKFDEVMTSDAHYYTDRFGVKRFTIAGFQYTAEEAIRAYGYITIDSFEDGATLTLPNQTLRYESTGEYYRWDGVFPKSVPSGSTPVSTGGVGLGAWVSVGDASLRSDLNSSSIPGASLVRTSNGDTVQEKLNIVQEKLNLFGKIATVFMEPGQTLMDAIGLLPANGGSVFIPEGNYYAGDYGAVFMQKPNVTLIGTKMATINPTASRMVGGSIIEGKFSVFADNFSMSNVSFDLGLDVCNARFPGANTTADYPHGGTWDAFSFGQVSQVSPLPARMNFSAQNVNGLLKDSATVGHGMLFEGIDGGYIDNATGVYGVHGLVIKSQNMRIGSINGYMASVDNIIFKSDAYALGGNITCASVMAGRYLPNCTPHSAPAISSFGVYFNPATANFSGPIQIANMQSRDAQYPVMFSNDNAGKVGPDIQFGLVDIDCNNAPTNDYAIFCANFGTYPRMHFASINIKNCKNGAFFRYPDSESSGVPQLTVGAFKATYLSGDAITIADFARVHIDSVEVFGAENAYAFADVTSLLTVNKERLSVTNKFKGFKPRLAAGWTNFDATNSTFDIALNANKVCLRGLLSYNTATGSGGLITALPPALRPAKAIRLPGYKNVGGVAQSCMIGIASSGLVTIDEGKAPATGSFVSIDGVEWELLR